MTEKKEWSKPILTIVDINELTKFNNGPRVDSLSSS